MYDCDDNEDPSHRESFAFPLCLAQVLAVTIATRNPRPGWRNVLSGEDEVLLSETTCGVVTGESVVAVSATTTLFIICWQFAQFMLFTQTTAIFGIYLLGVLPQESMHSILVAQVNQRSFI